METIMAKETVIVYTYRYIFKDKKGKLHVKFLTEPQEAHARFQQAIRDNDDIVSCIREYVSEVNFEYFGYTEPVKTEEKENKENDNEKTS